MTEEVERFIEIKPIRSINKGKKEKAEIEMIFHCPDGQVLSENIILPIQSIGLFSMEDFVKAMSKMYYDMRFKSACQDRHMRFEEFAGNVYSSKL